MKTNKGTPVVVTTEHRGVFFGYIDPATVNDSTIRLQNSRLCIYWSEDMRGFMGLAVYGPSAKCRIGPPANITLRNITAVLEVNADAVANWEKAPWSK